MAKKTHVKVRLVPEAKPDSSFFYYVKKPAGGEKAKVKLKAKKLFFFKISFLEINVCSNHIFPNMICNFWIYLLLY